MKPSNNSFFFNTANIIEPKNVAIKIKEATIIEFATINPVIESTLANILSSGRLSTKLCKRGFVTSFY
jgi:hypothetical protein